MSRSGVFWLSLLLLLGGGAVLFFVAGGGSDSHAGAAAPAAGTLPAEAAAAPRLADKALPGTQLELLDLAFRAATALPLEPHVKNRCRAQEKVVGACFELELPQRALGYIEKIDNWRRGVGYADFAFYSVRHGDTDVQRYLDLASQVAEGLKLTDDIESDDVDQEWRRDLIRVRIAQTHALLGRQDLADQFVADAVPTEAAKMSSVEAMLGDEEVFDAQLEALDGVVAAGNLDGARTALDACAHLFDRFFEDEARRALIVEKITSYRTKLPASILVEALVTMAECALEHEDPAQTLELADEIVAVVGANCTHVPVLARLASLRHRAGDHERARSEADKALVIFEDHRDEIVDIERADALRPLAEAYHAMGDRAAALAVYQKAIEESVHNPNSRPRAEDLTATCLSMALNQVEPDAGLWARINEVYDALGPPW